MEDVEAYTMQQVVGFLSRGSRPIQEVRRKCMGATDKQFASVVSSLKADGLIALDVSFKMSLVLTEESPDDLSFESKEEAADFIESIGVALMNSNVGISRFVSRRDNNDNFAAGARLKKVAARIRDEYSDLDY